MEDWPSVPPSSSLHFADIVVYQQGKFNMWDNANDFGAHSIAAFQHDYTNLLTRSTGCLLIRADNGEYDLYASAFVVKHFPANSHVQLPDASRVKALLLTAGHVFTSPFSTDGALVDLFFTLSPTPKAPDINNYSKFRVQRIFQFDLFQGQQQDDPLLNYPFMLPEDVELLAILENDQNHIPGLVANIDVFEELEFEAWNESRTGELRNCVVVGYPSALEKKRDFVSLWAPAAFDNPGRTQQVAALIPPNGTQRVFSVGTVRGSNANCIAVSSSTWAGMSGGPICVRSENRPDRLVFCGVYNGSAAVPFQSLISKILFSLQGVNVNITLADIPRSPNATSRPEHLVWMITLQKFLELMTRGYNGHIDFINRLNMPIREFLVDAAAAGMDVQHNLGVKGGNRFTNIITGLAAIMPGGANPHTLNCNLPTWNGNPNFVNANLKTRTDHFWENGITRKTKTLRIFTTDAYALACKLISDLKTFKEKLRANPQYPLERIHRKFERKILPRFRKILQMWLAGLA